MLYAISRNSFFFFLLNLHFGKRLYSIITISCEKKYVHMRTSYFFRREKSSEICQIIVWSFSRKCNVTIFSDSFQSIISFLYTPVRTFSLPNTNQQNFKCIIIHTHLLHCIANMHYSVTFPKRPFKIISSNCFQVFWAQKLGIYPKNQKSLSIFLRVVNLGWPFFTLSHSEQSAQKKISSLL